MLDKTKFNIRTSIMLSQTFPFAFLTHNGMKMTKVVKHLTHNLIFVTSRGHSTLSPLFYPMGRAVSHWSLCLSFVVVTRGRRSSAVWPRGSPSRSQCLSDYSCLSAWGKNVHLCLQCGLSENCSAAFVIKGLKKNKNKWWTHRPKKCN